MKHLASALLCIICCLGSYQDAFAADNGFSAFRVRPGDFVVTLLRRHGFSITDRERVLSAAHGLGSLLLTTEMSYFVSKTRDEVSLKIFDPMSDRGFILWKKKSGAGADTFRPDFRVVTERYEGILRGSLVSSLYAKVPSNWIASRFMDAYILEHDLANLPSGAKFWLTVEKKYEGNHFIRYGEVLQAALEINGTMIKKDFVKMNQGGVFVSPKDLFSERPFYAPVEYLRIASLFQPARRHPITHKVKAHLGIDFELPEGDPVYAARKGTVVRMGRNRAAGNFIVVQHAGGYETAYDHLSKVSPGIRPGRTVQTGQTIGEVGCTGYCTRPHLHFAVKVRGRMVNPAPYIRAFPPQFEQMLQAKIARRD